MSTKITSKVVSDDGLTIFERTDGNADKFAIGYDHTATSFKISKGNSLGTEDVLTIDATGNLTLGSASKTTSDTDTAGLNTVFTGGSGTGTGAGGSIKFNVACAGSSGTTVNAADDTVMTISAGADAAGSTVTIAGNLTVNGTTTTINSTTVTIDDPVFTLGGDSAPSEDDNKDRGIEFRYYNGSAKLGFFGYDDNTSKFTFIADATNSGEIFSGTVGDVAFGNGDFNDGLTVSGAALSLSHSLTQTGSNANTLTGATTISNNLTVSSGAFDFDVASHDGTNGLRLAGILVTSTAAELNILDGTTTPDNSTAIADGDGFVVNDVSDSSGTLKQITASSLKNYIQSGSTSSSRLELDGHTTIPDTPDEGLIIQISETEIVDSTADVTSIDMYTQKIEQITLNNSNSSAYQSAASLFIANAPIAGGVGNNASITDAFALQVGAGTSKFGGVVNISDNTTSTTTTTGALIVGGGVGIAENTNIGGTLDVTGDASVTTFDSSGATSLATGGGVVNIASTGLMTTVKGTLNVDEAVTLDGTLDITGDTSVTTFDSSGATSLATGGGVVNIASTGLMTTVKGTLNVDEAVTLDSTLDVTGDTSVTTFDSTGATSLATGGGVVDIASSGIMTTVKGTLNVDEAVTLDSTLDVTGDTSVTTFDSSGATSLATGGGVVNIASSGIMTTVKGTLNVDEAVTLDSTLDVTGDTSVTTFDSSGATSLATGGGVVNIASSGIMTTVKGTLNVDEAVTLDSTLDVTGDTSVTTFDSLGATSLATGGGVVNIASTGLMTTVKGTLNVDEAVTLDGTLDVTGVVTLSDNTTSSSSSTGALIVAGGVGIAENANIGGKLTVEGDTATGDEAAIGYTASEGIIITGQGSTSDVTIKNDDDTTVFSIATGTTNSTFTGSVSSSEFVTTSDKRLKTNIVTLENSLEKVLNLRGVNFDWIDTKKYTDKRQIGFIAQEVEEVAPELVNQNNDYKTVNYAQTVSLLVEAIKDQNDIINDLIDEVDYIKKNYTKKRVSKK